MNLEHTLEKIDRLNDDKYLQQQIAQLNARYILFNTNENEENFPNYNVKDDNLTLLAFQYLNLGCRLAENDFLDKSADPLEKGAQILEYIYGSKNNEISNRNYYSLISAMSYYAGFHYSKSFILIGKIESDTVISKLVSLFLKRKFIILQNFINEILIDDNYLKILKNEEEIDETANRIYEIVIARGLGKIISYLNFGNVELLEEAKEELKTLKEIAEIREEPDIWWIIRLILIIIGGIEKASLWSVFKNYYEKIPTLVSDFIYSHVFAEYTKIHEFFTTQRQALEQVIGKDSGLVISMPTSSGKTRIAEVAILDCKIKDNNSKILFIAPYRSLAFEIENDLERIFNSTGIIISQLYGGSLFSKLDEKIIEETDVIIATQEKAKAMLRSNSEIIKNIKLVILDEGHLLGADERLIRSELFIEELRFNVTKNKGKFILLSAVLPNPKDLAEWLTVSNENIFKSEWRPSEERLGVLEWTGSRVNLNWKSADDERESFNKNFLISRLLPRVKYQRIDKYSINDKNEAVANTARKLFTFGPVLVFVGIKASVFTIAKAYLKSLGEKPENFEWKNQNNWKAFELSCIEFDGNDSKWLKYAQKGIICHNADLPENVRAPLERLIRSEKPYIIIATSTLGQGVNLGVSSVIFSTLHQPKGERQMPLNHRDFWNIAGRAGRAFVDHEGKILITLDRTQSKWHQSRDIELINSYFDKTKMNNVQSGLLALIKALKYISVRFENLDFNSFLQLISENDFDNLKEKENIISIIDLVDDTLLSLHEMLGNENSLDVSWVENFFRKSLAYILINDDDANLKKEELTDFVKARIKGIIKSVGEDKANWKAYISSGIPLQSDLILENKIPGIIQEINNYLEFPIYSVDNKISLLSNIEKIINEIPVLSEGYLRNESIDKIRSLWIKGSSILEIKKLENYHKIIKEHFNYKLPWVLNGIAKKLEGRGFDVHSEIIQELSILVEVGLPNLIAVKVYQAGIRSRSASIEISEYFSDDSWGLSINYYKKEIARWANIHKAILSENTACWIDLFLSYSKKQLAMITEIEPFQIEELVHWNGQLFPKTIQGGNYLISSDLKVIFDIKKINGVDFSEVLNMEGLYFYKESHTNLWTLENKNPNIKIISNSGVSFGIT